MACASHPGWLWTPPGICMSPISATIAYSNTTRPLPRPPYPAVATPPRIRCSGSPGPSRPIAAGPVPEGLCNPAGVGADPSNNVYIADYNNSRVLEYNTPLIVTGVIGSGDTTADRVFGQPDMVSSNCNQNSTFGVPPTANTLCKPDDVISDAGGNIYIADTGNGRTLEYDKPLLTDTTADRVFGHNGSFTEGADGKSCNNGFDPSPPTADTLCFPTGLSMDTFGDLLVADFDNSRVVEYNHPLAKNSEPGSGDGTADRVYGQGGVFTTNYCDGPPAATLISAGTLCYPHAVAVAGDNTVFIADSTSERLLAYGPAAALSPTPTPSATPSTAPTLIPTPAPTRSLLPTGSPGFTPTATPTPTGGHTRTPTPTPTPPRCVGTTPKPTVPVPTPTPLPGYPVVSSVTSPILVGAGFTIKGRNFTKGSMVNFFVATATRPVNAGPLKPSALSTTTQLTVPVPITVPQGQGFASIQVVNTDKGFVASNLGYALLEGSAAAGLPAITKINGYGLAATSIEPGFATANVETTLAQGSTVVLGGGGFDVTQGVAVDVFCACPGGKLPTTFLNPGNPNLTAGSVTFTIPASAPTGPGSIVVSNAGAGKTYTVKSDAVSVPIGARINVLGVTPERHHHYGYGNRLLDPDGDQLLQSAAGRRGKPGRNQGRRYGEDSADRAEFDQVHVY